MTHLILAAAIGLPLYVAFSLIRPTKPCRRCGGWGSKPGRRPRSARRHCHRCDGTGKRFRVPARLAYSIRSAMRRHGELTARAAAREAEAGSARRLDQSKETALCAGPGRQRAAAGRAAAWSWPLSSPRC